MRIVYISSYRFIEKWKTLLDSNWLPKSSLHILYFNIKCAMAVLECFTLLRGEKYICIFFYCPKKILYVFEELIVKVVSMYLWNHVTLTKFCLIEVNIVPIMRLINVSYPHVEILTVALHMLRETKYSEIMNRTSTAVAKM